MMMIRPIGLACLAATISLQSIAVRADDFAAMRERARGATVDFFLWGGDERINAYVSSFVADAALRTLGITVNRVGLADTAEAVNLVVAETEAGRGDDGSVDLIWLNGENFRTLKEKGLLACGWADRIPNAALVDWSDPSISTDFGIPVDGCEAPWSRAQFAFATDARRVPDPPRTMADLIAWIRAHPGRFTYAAPPDFNGSAFVRHVFVHVAGGPEAVAGPFDQTRFDAIADRAFALLEELEPFLWRQGATYPTDINQLNQLFANGEVDFTFNYEATAFGAGVENGTLPPTTVSYALDDGTVANTSYLAVPANAGDRAAAMLVADLLTGVEAQLEKAKPDVWGMATVLDLDRLPPEAAAAFRALPRHPAVVSEEDLADRAMPELGAAWLEAIEAGWIRRVDL
jgi:putative spermidine/putrescine transport system substrate-binding protein